MDETGRGAVEEENPVDFGSTENKESISDMIRGSSMIDHPKANSPATPGQSNTELTRALKPTEQTKSCGLNHENLLGPVLQEESEQVEHRPLDRNHVVETALQGIQSQFSLLQHKNATLRAKSNAVEETNRKLGQKIRKLQTENEKLKVQNAEITTSLQVAQEQYQRLALRSRNTR